MWTTAGHFNSLRHTILSSGLQGKNTELFSIQVLNRNELIFQNVSIIYRRDVVLWLKVL
jgi:hypothetical protein